MSYSYEYLLEEAARFWAACGTRAVMFNPDAREAALKAFCYVAVRCFDPRAQAVFESHVVNFQCRLLHVQTREEVSCG
jgi:tRNA(Met) C34 N-acetyltransferase TmcA